MATYRPDGTRIRKRDKKRNRGNVGVGTSEPAGNVGAGTSAPEGNVGAGSSAPEPPPPGPIVSDDRDAEGNVGVGTTH
jgi:hypothetical protein